MKIDISKAYDRVNWDFLQNKMIHLGFSSKWVHWIMMCVKNVKYSILLNGMEVGPIIPGRGLQQGCLLSPYLFLLCAEGLSLLFHEVSRVGILKGVKAGCNCPSVTHLQFANDSFFFLEGPMVNAIAVRVILLKYERASRQSINFTKSRIFFSPNFNREVTEGISNVLNVYNSLGDSNYLGLPSLIGRSKKQVFGFLKDQLEKRIGSWSSRFLSGAGKEILIKSVTQAIPSYCMSVFKIFVTICDALQK